MLDVVYEFFGLAILDNPPQNLAELIPYLLQYLTAVSFVLATFWLIGGIARLFFDWRWFK